MEGRLTQLEGGCLLKNETLEKVIEEAMKLYRVPGGREMLMNRIRTPLSNEEIEQGLKDGRITPVMYRKTRQTKRDENGSRIYDITFDDDTGEKTVEIKKGKQFIRLSMDELNQEFDKLRHQNIS